MILFRACKRQNVKKNIPIRVATSAERYCGGEQNKVKKNNMECPLAILHPKNNRKFHKSTITWDVLNAPADKYSQISCKRMQRKLAFNLLSAAEIHEIILLRKLSSAAPCGHRLRCRYQNSGGGYSVASYILSSLREERLGEKGGAFLNGKEGRVGFRKILCKNLS